MVLGEIINTEFPYADIDVLPPTGIGVRYWKIVTLSDDVSFVLVYSLGEGREPCQVNCFDNNTDHSLSPQCGENTWSLYYMGMIADRLSHSVQRFVAGVC